MLIAVFCFLLGHLLCCNLQYLPAYSYFFVLLLASSIGFWLGRKTCLGKPLLYIWFFIFGAFSFGVHADLQLAKQLPKKFENKKILVEGEIISIPQNYSHETRFIFLLQKIMTAKKIIPMELHVQLSWGRPQKISIGDQWHLLIKIKRPHGYANPGSFNTESWQFFNNIQAKGYVVSSQENKMIAQKKVFWFLKLRQKIYDRIQQSFQDNVFIGIIQALTTGIKSGITPNQWQVLQSTGTIHLVIIAGLHLGFFTGFIYIIINYLWRLWPRLLLIVPAGIAATLGGLAGALFYSALAGFAIPTQRALIMMTVLLAAHISRRHIAPSYSYSAALFIVLLADPFAVMDPGFWLSFAAVAILFFGLYGRISVQSVWWHHGRAQWVLSIGLIPLTLWFFEQAALISFIANVIAIPIIGFCVMPLALLGTFLFFIYTPPGIFLIKSALLVLKILWPVLVFLSKLSGQGCFFIFPSFGIFLIAMAGFLLLLAPRGFPAKYLGLCLIIPVVYGIKNIPKPGEIRFTLLDVGQGLASVIQTRHHVLIYDTGPKYGEDFDTGKAVLIPYLHHQSIFKIDALVISHNDSDHVGGAKTLLAVFPVEKIFMSALYAPLQEYEQRMNYCKAGETWRWDGVEFQFIYPFEHLHFSKNNQSCVLKVSTGAYSILLPGDIEKNAEYYLADHAAEKNLQADILIAPHHGSITSSSQPFIKAVVPKFVLFSSGYLNRFGFPSPIVKQRYLAYHARTLNTVDEGAMSFVLTPNGIKQISLYRQEHKKFWQQ